MAPAGNWAAVEIEVMPMGDIHICYQDSVTGRIYVASCDSVWHTADLGQWGSFYGRHLVQGPYPRPTVLLEADSAISYATLTDTGWTTASFPWSPRIFGAFLAFDTADNRALVYLHGDGENTLETALEQGGTWTRDWISSDFPIMHTYIQFPTNFALGSTGQFYFTHGLWHWPTSGHSQTYWVNQGRTGAWSEQGVGSSNCDVKSMAPTLAPGYTVCYNAGPWDRAWLFYCDGDTIETLPAVSARIRVDAQGRRQMLYYLGRLKHAFDAGIWHVDSLPEEMNFRQYDFATDPDALPLVAFVSPSGIFLARGDFLSAEAQKPEALLDPPEIPSVIRRVICLPEACGNQNSPPPALLDLTGRKVLNLHPGVNDVSHLVPGVYFVHRQDELRTVKVVVQ